MVSSKAAQSRLIVGLKHGPGCSARSPTQSHPGTLVLLDVPLVTVELESNLGPICVHL